MSSLDFRGDEEQRRRALVSHVRIKAVLDTLRLPQIFFLLATALVTINLFFHLYGADLCLAARQRGRPAVTVDALCFHNSRTAELPPDFRASAAVFARKWQDQLPVATPCARIGTTWLRE